ncbi:MAG TPA: hypothetical protein VK447_14160 [Myxococcaceae bacterium]|nr:hypothetical protein [Myxococcaceae bacterium]
MAARTFSTLETNILKAKGVTPAQIKKLVSMGVRSRADFTTVGDAATLSELAGLSAELAAKVMAWATGVQATGAQATGGSVVVEGADTVYCSHCRTRQPKDYKTGDLCTACGRQVEPTQSCYWCSATGPGRYCRGCGAELVPTGELELAIQLKRDGLPKDEIPGRLKKMSPADKDLLWGRIRKAGRA